MAREVEQGSTDTRDAASETLSQLAAKVLTQLSLSAWLPSAALVLLLALILELGTQWRSGASLGASFGGAIDAIGDTTFSGVVLLFLVVVVTTMVTQAFSFGAIRVLEGYWGPGVRIDKVARKRTRRHADRLSALQLRYQELQNSAWGDVEAAVSSVKPKFTAAMMQKLRERVTGKAATRSLAHDQRQRVRALDWEALVDATTLRQLRNVEMRMSDYPRDASRVMPTRLGNVLRRFEVETGADDVENFVERSYRHLPFSMQLSHDEQRARLDLYCSMVFVLVFGALVAVVSFGWWAWPFTLVVASTLIASSYVAYRAAVASARYYGTLLIGIADWLKETEARDDIATGDDADADSEPTHA